MFPRGTKSYGSLCIGLHVCRGSFLEEIILPHGLFIDCPRKKDLEEWLVSFSESFSGGVMSLC